MRRISMMMIMKVQKIPLQVYRRIRNNLPKH
uniref:Uncharacterized protein n=1 Tax=Arundo donax TaxID=35708 RepID=A0A0A9GB12_ARUDO